jgi:5-methylcytosine-specific restriction endonuclease McrA
VTGELPEERNPARRETLAIPQSLREQVDERDKCHCRVCGRHLGDERALHHIRYGGSRQGMGGRRDHSLDNLITVCWMWAGNCHDLVHASKRIYLPVLEQLTVTPGVTALQLLRWQARSRKT